MSSMNMQRKRSTVIQLNLISIEEDGYHIMFEALINGIKSNLLIDTGASRTVFDRDSIYKFLPEDPAEFEINEKLSTGLGTDSLESQVAVLDKLEFGECVIENYSVVVLDMSHVNQSYAKLDLPAIDGVLGSDLMVKYEAVIDYKGKMLKLYY